MARNVETLVVFRVIQAAGAALMTPTSLGLLLASFPAEKRAGAVRAWTAIGGFAAALGPLVGGLLVTVSWRWIFTINVPIGLIASLAGWQILPRVPGHEAPRPNLWAAFLITGEIAALTFTIVKVNDWGWTSPGIAASLVFALILIVLFVHHCLRSANPFVDPTLFRARPYTGAALSFAPYGAAFGAMLLSIAIWQQTAWEWSALKTGLAIAPGPLLVPVTSLLFARKLISRFGSATVATAGALFFAAGPLFWATMIGANPNIAVVIIGMMCTGIGVGLTFPTLMGRHRISAALIVRHRFGRDHHDPASHHCDRRSTLCCNHRYTGVSGGAGHGVPPRLVGRGRSRTDQHHPQSACDWPA